FDSLDSALDFYTSYLLELKDRAGARPLVTTGFCYSAGFLVEINKRTPGLIDGMAHSGLIIPDRKIGLDYSIAVESKMYEDALIRENPAVRVRADRIYAELGWTHDRNPFGNVQTLILKGQNDPFMTPAACQLFQKWASQFPETVNYMEIEGGGHGVFRPIANFPQSTATVRQAVLALIDRVVTSK
ncbi:MAG: hypothetical protein KDD70_19105, partial [Bdellovibrionales bacterium]|nr:hypothetical protein [Bdellovibrionales bacterium]